MRLEAAQADGKLVEEFGRSLEFLDMFLFCT